MHSKGPWTAEPWGTPCEETGLDLVDVLDADGGVVVTSLANDGRLIAAAPDMLEALKAVAECKFCILCQTCRNKVDAVIDKVEGRDAQ